MKNIILLGLCCTLLFACNPSKKLKTTTLEKPSVDTRYQFPYSINQPSEVFKLPPVLKEISGLGYCAADGSLCAVQDENGLLFNISTTTGEVISKKKFYKDGDYEGIEMVGDKIYIVKSTGTIYEISDLDKKEPTIKKYKSFMTKKHNVEGLSYDPKTNDLILACKGKGMDTPEAEENRIICTFDLDTKEMATKPLFTFKKESLLAFIDENIPEEERAAFDSLDPEPGKLKLGPSGIAVHPFTGNYYVISSRGKVMMVSSPDGDLLHIVKLDKKTHFQPEGIAFDPSGTLYISTEADKQDASFIYKFEMISKN